MRHSQFARAARPVPAGTCALRSFIQRSCLCLGIFCLSGTLQAGQSQAVGNALARQIVSEELYSRWTAAKELAIEGRRELALETFRKIRKAIRRSPSASTFASLDSQCAVMIAQLSKEPARPATTASPLKTGTEISRMLSEAQRAFGRSDFQRSTELCNEVLALDPHHVQANSLKWLSHEENTHQRMVRSEQAIRKGRGRLRLSGLAEMTPPEAGKVLTYPDPETWRQLTERRKKYQQRRHPKKPKEPWELEIERNMQGPLSFDFQDSPLEDVLQFFSDATRVNIILDRSAVRDAQQPVTLSVNKMKAISALKWVLKIVDLEYIIDNDAIFVSSKDRLKQSQPEFRVYDFDDIVNAGGAPGRSGRSAADWIKFLKQMTQPESRTDDDKEGADGE